MCIECIRSIIFRLWSLVRMLSSCKSRNICISQASLGGLSQALSVVRSGLRELFQYILCYMILEPWDSSCVDVYGWSLSKQLSIQLPRVTLYYTCLTVSPLKLLCLSDIHTTSWFFTKFLTRHFLSFFSKQDRLLRFCSQSMSVLQNPTAWE